MCELMCGVLYGVPGQVMRGVLYGVPGQLMRGVLYGVPGQLMRDVLYGVPGQLMRGVLYGVPRHVRLMSFPHVRSRAQARRMRRTSLSQINERHANVRGEWGKRRSMHASINANACTQLSMVHYTYTIHACSAMARLTSVGPKVAAAPSKIPFDWLALCADTKRCVGCLLCLLLTPH